MKKKQIRFVTLAIILLLLPTSNVLAKAKPKLSKTSITITKGKTYTLKVKNNKKKVKWSSKNRKIATVSSKGKVKAIKSGTTYVYAKIKGSKTLKCKVKVKNPITKPTSSSNTNNNFSISKIYSKLSMQQSQKLYAIFESGKSNETVKWESTNKEVATIDQSGLVKAKSIGTTIIIATYNNI
ncbi:MAG: Ig-like domain-containing protein [Anaerostipes sp.]|nr:Ig-like domain-containing protein [Anaerostipes sp.]